MTRQILLVEIQTNPNPFPLAIFGTLASGDQGVAYSSALSVSNGTPAYTWATVGTLPTGLSINSSTGVISGTPTALGIYTFTVRVIDSNGIQADSLQTVVISAAISLSGGLPSGQVGELYSGLIIRAGGTPAYTWSITAGTLPAGTSIDASTGVISGTCTTAASYTFTVTVTDGLGQSANASRTVVIAAAEIYYDVVNNLGPVFWAALDEVSGTTAADSSTYANDGTYVGSPTLNLSAPTGFAGVKGGVGFSSTRYATFSNQSQLQLAGGDVTLVLVAKLGTSAQTSFVATKGPDYGIVYGLRSNKYEFNNSPPMGAGTGNFGGITVTDTNTHMIVYRFVNATKTLSAWLDGGGPTDFISGFTLEGDASDIWIAQGPAGGSAFAGSIYDFQIYDRALTNSEVSRLWHSRNNP